MRIQYNYNRVGTERQALVQAVSNILGEVAVYLKAYCQLVTALCKMAKGQKRVTAKEKDIQNDKFTMRLFLIRLGFIGDEYKAARKILLRNLTGNSSWKSGRRPETASTDAETVAFEIIVTDTPKPENGGGDPYGK